MQNLQTTDTEKRNVMSAKEQLEMQYAEIKLQLTRALEGNEKNTYF